ncbi:MAG: hypothetical protein B7Y01_04870, partial [Xanthobacter sp. 17-67-6]
MDSQRDSALPVASAGAPAAGPASRPARAQAKRSVASATKKSNKSDQIVGRLTTDRGQRAAAKAQALAAALAEAEGAAVPDTSAATASAAPDHMLTAVDVDPLAQVGEARRRGRGAVSNAAGRFEPAARILFDDGW